MHVPARVLRQFGLRQHIPRHVERIERNPRKGAHHANWEVIRQDYIQRWDLREEQVVMERADAPDLGVYLRWYWRITHRWIFQENKALKEYIPRGPVERELVQELEELSTMAHDALRMTTEQELRNTFLRMIKKLRPALQRTRNASRDGREERPIEYGWRCRRGHTEAGSIRTHDEAGGSQQAQAGCSQAVRVDADTMRSQLHTQPDEELIRAHVEGSMSFHVNVGWKEVCKMVECDRDPLYPKRYNLLESEEPAIAVEGSDSSANPNPSTDPKPSSPCSVITITDGAYDGWSPCFRDDDIMEQQSAIKAVEAAKIPYVGDKEPLSSLAAEFQSGSPILQEKIKLIGEQYAALRRTRGDGNCFFRSFMFSYLEHILETQDKTEVERVTMNIDQCKKTLQGLGYADFTFEDFFSIFFEQLESVLQGTETSISHEELLQRSRDQSVSDYVVMFFRFVTSGEIRRRSDFFEPFIVGLTNSTVDQFCKASVEPMGEESDHVHITALSDALGVPIRVVYLDRSSCEAGVLTVNHHDFIPSVAHPNPLASEQGADASTAETTENSPPPKPFVTLLYRPGHYDILYPK
ncbi:uncharacterized protein LOC109838641 [Asparagus officinalis]|uniref:uncharacterized protein LOC109838641 n=1 Tax=Asparagus officinalis TaxID=4686 RepID=UPI00098E7349|nr:uncharacterized protein LOC109838641 [Asparagus officinalis]